MQRTCFGLVLVVVAVVAPGGRGARAEEASPVLSAAPWTRASGQGVALGFENGIWGHQSASGLRVRVPLGWRFALNARSLVLYGFRPDDTRVDLLGRLELCGGAPVYLNLLRAYGAGGPTVGRRLSGAGGHDMVYGFGGHAGLETFLAPKLSLYFEIGGNGTTDDSDSGGTVVAGLLIYLR